MNPEERKLDWVSYHDPKSRHYSIRNYLKGKRIEKKRVMWDEGTVLDQGSEGACVGFAWLGELLAQPAAPDQQPTARQGYSIAVDYYKRAQKIDQWPGEDYEGTSVLAGAKIVLEEGFMDSYRWCFGVDDVRDAVITTGPVVIGIPWLSGMYSTGANGLVKVSGKQVGGHALVITGYDPAMRIGNKTYEVFKWRNSWGSDYGVEGSGYIRVIDLASLLAKNGEACVPIGRKKPVFGGLWKNVQNIFISRLFRNG
jgi:hypothetical protein